MVLVLGSVFGVFAKTDSRPCVFCPPSMAASYFLLLAQKKVTKEKGTLGFAPSPKARVRYGRTGSAHRASCPVVRIGAVPRAARASRGFSVHPPPLLRGNPRAKQSGSESRRVGYIRRFCGRDCRALLFRVPSRPRQGLGGKAAKRWPAGCRPLRREHTDVLQAKPSGHLRSHAGRDARVTAAARVPFSWVTFFWASKRK